jgi:uncharacterized protein (TIGR02466 family)
MIYDLFSVPFYSCRLNLDNSIIEKYCYEVKKKDKGRVISNEGGWQSNLLEGYMPELNDLFKEMVIKTNEFANDIGLVTPLKLSAGWININGFKDSNIVHNHPNCLLSTIYYVKTNNKSGQIEFQNPVMDLMAENVSNETVKEYTNYVSGRKIFSPDNERLFIFPGYLNHYVRPNLSKEDRISIACNFVRDY